jgi:hypothetical protein
VHTPPDSAHAAPPEHHGVGGGRVARLDGSANVAANQAAAARIAARLIPLRTHLLIVNRAASGERASVPGNPSRMIAKEAVSA